MPDIKRSLSFHGILLFLLGLLLGLAEEQFVNPRMGLAAHLEGLMNGTFLIAVAAIWNDSRMSARSSLICYFGLLYGAYANLAVTTLAASWGTNSLTPLAGMQVAEQWQQVAVAAGFVSVAIAMIVSTSVLLWGFRRHKSE